MAYSLVERVLVKRYILEETFQQIMKHWLIGSVEWKSWDGEWALVHAFGTIDRIEFQLTQPNKEPIIYHMDRFKEEFYLLTCVKGNDVFSGYGLTQSQHLQVWEKIMEHPRFRLLWICGGI